MQVVWFRRDLRTLDNTALFHATRTGDSVAAIYVATPDQWKTHTQSPIQTDLIYRRLLELKKQLRLLNIPLFYYESENYDHAVSEVLSLTGEFADSSVSVHINCDYELNEVKRDALLSARAESLGIKVHHYHDRCFFPPGSVLNNKEEMFKVFTPFKKRWLSLFAQSQLDVLKPSEVHKHDFSSISFPVFKADSPFTYPRADSHEYDIDDKHILITLRHFCSEDVKQYHLKRDFPFIDATSGLSPYLAIGALSIRQCIARLRIEMQGVSESEGQSKWLDELIWREFYQHLSAENPELSKGKPFHSWGSNLNWGNNQGHFDAWKRGLTGFPIVDAAMRQLNTKGWMHNRLRMITASFLTKDLLVDWRLGEEYFMRHLIDGDYASNNGGWQWCASTGCDGQPYFRIFNPTTQSEKFDPNGEFIRRWVPELEEVPDKFIHCPSSWSGFFDLKYPAPIVDHKVQREIALSLYKEAKG